MGRVLDITDRLSFEESPSLQIKDKKIAVNADAPTMLRVMGLLSTEDPGMEEALAAYDLLFPEKSRKEIDKLKLGIADLVTVIQSAAELVTGKGLGE